MSDAPARLDFAGRRVVVTGRASGIGQQISHILGARGAMVVGLDLRHPTGPVDEFHPADLNDSGSIEDAASAVGDPVDALFNVAGVPCRALPGSRLA